MRETAETQKITNLTWQPYFFTIYHFDSGSVNVDRPIKICHVSACHVSTNSRPVRNFLFQISHISGPSDQSSVNVDRPIKRCHVEMINCKKVRLPRQICNFLYFRGFTYGIQVFCFSKVLFSSFASPSRRIARIAI